MPVRITSHAPWLLLIVGTIYEQFIECFSFAPVNTTLDIVHPTNTHSSSETHDREALQWDAGTHLISLAISSSVSHSLLMMKKRNSTRATRPITEPKVAPAISQTLLAAKEERHQLQSQLHTMRLYAWVSTYVWRLPSWCGSCRSRLCCWPCIHTFLTCFWSGCSASGCLAFHLKRYYNHLMT